MNLGKKKKLTKRTFNVGEDRIIFVESKLDEIKEAITKQDIRDLRKSGAIIIKEIRGRKKVRQGANRGVGNLRKNIKERKKRYVILTRKLRNYLKGLYSAGELSKENLDNLRKKIRNKEFRSKAHIKEYIGGIKK